VVNSYQAELDLHPIETWMNQVGIINGPLETVERLAGGTQHLMLRLKANGRAFVLRSPIARSFDEGAAVIRREARILAALHETDVPHPALTAACTDDTVWKAAFHVTEAVTGFGPAVELPDLHRRADVQRDMWLAMVGAIARVSRLDLEAAQLTDLGRSAGWLERQVPRWSSQLRSYDEIDGCQDERLPGVGEIASWLNRRRPATCSIGLVHGDYHLANVLIDPDSSAVAAIVDWELATLGDPLLDMGQFLVTSGHGCMEWWSHDNPALCDVSVPSNDQLVSHYEDLSRRDVNDLKWYQVLACFRLGILLEGTHARATAGLAPVATGELLHWRAVWLFERALELIGGGR
jgi:aminoglycoside phosphotransferase (APT) family kinase protein